MKKQIAEKDIVIRVPQKLYDSNIQKFINYVEFKKIASKSKATDKDIEKILKEIKGERRPLVEKMLKKANIKL